MERKEGKGDLLSSRHCGWQGKEQRVSLMGWSGERRIIILRRLHQKEKKTQRIGIRQSLFIAELCPEDGFEYAVLVTSLKHPIPTVTQFYRDRADSENTFSDLKNDWGWGGFTTHDHARNQLMARLVALVYTWWNIYVRQISPLQHREGHVSRPALLHGVAKKNYPCRKNHPAHDEHPRTRAGHHDRTHHHQHQTQTNCDAVGSP